jgi:hypothetical protein
MQSSSAFVIRALDHPSNATTPDKPPVYLKSLLFRHYHFHQQAQPQSQAWTRTPRFRVALLVHTGAFGDHPQYFVDTFRLESISHRQLSMHPHMRICVRLWIREDVESNIGADLRRLYGHLQH